MTYSAHQDEEDSDYATPIDAIKALDAAQSQRLLGLVHLTASKATIETGTLEIPGQRLLSHSGTSDSSVVQSETCHDLYDTPADALKDEGLELSHRGVQRRVYTMENSPEDKGVHKGMYTVENSPSPEEKGVQKIVEKSPENMVEMSAYTVENSPENKGVHRVCTMENSAEDMVEQKNGGPEESYDEPLVLMVASPNLKVRMR